MRRWRALGPSLRSVLAHPGRSALAASGVAIGIAAVLVTAAVGRGAQAQVLGDLGGMGMNLVIVRPAQVKQTTARKQVRGVVSTLRLEDSLALQEVPMAAGVAPSVEGPVKLKTDEGAIATSVLGTTSAFFAVRGFELAQGRLFDEREGVERARVVVLGGRASAALFPGQNPVGQELRIGGVGFEVIGSLQLKGASGDGSDADKQVFVPVQTALRRLFNTRSLSRIFIGVREQADLEPVKQSVRGLLRERHRLDRRDLPDDFAVQDQQRFLSAQRQTAESLEAFTLGLSAISLLVGGAGILALMMLSVRERTPEIGLRRAVGARPRDILFQFLAEALVLSLAGGLAGIVVGGAASVLAARATGWPIEVTPQALLLALGTSLLVGLASGAVPARKAAAMVPVRALGLE
ncbi:MAG: ABC transporter permease [Myxococcales bacterium]